MDAFGLAMLRGRYRSASARRRAQLHLAGVDEVQKFLQTDLGAVERCATHFRSPSLYVAFRLLNSLYEMTPSC